MKIVNHWIDGKNITSNDYFTTINPATGEVLADVASGGIKRSTKPLLPRKVLSLTGLTCR